jgi:hypothetical protein
VHTHTLNIQLQSTMARPPPCSPGRGGRGLGAVHAYQRQENRNLPAQNTLAYTELIVTRNGAVLSREQIREERLRLGYCTECEGEPIRLFNISRPRYNPLWWSKTPLTERGESFEGVCLVCHPERDPDRLRRSNRRPRGGRREAGSRRTIQQDRGSSRQFSDSSPASASSSRGTRTPTINQRLHQSDGAMPLAEVVRAEDVMSSVPRPPLSSPPPRCRAPSPGPDDRPLRGSEPPRTTQSPRVDGLRHRPLSNSAPELRNQRTEQQAQGALGTAEGDLSGSMNPEISHESLVQLSQIDERSTETDSLEQMYERSRRLSRRSVGILRPSSFQRDSSAPTQQGAVQVQRSQRSLRPQYPRHPSVRFALDRASEESPEQDYMGDETEHTSNLRPNENISRWYGEGTGQMAPPPRPVNGSPIAVGVVADRLPPTSSDALNETSFSVLDLAEPGSDKILEDFKQLIKDMSSAGMNSDVVADSVYRMMSDNADDEPIVAYCLKTVSEFCRKSQVFLQSFMSQDTPQILEAMKDHMSSRQIQCAGIAALWSLCENQDNCVILSRAMAPARILRAIMDHESDEDLVITGIGALRTMSTDPEVRDSLGPLKAKEHVCRVMGRFRSVAAIQRDGCALLSNASVDMENEQVAVAKREELDAIVQAMKAHQGDSSVVGGACFALKNYTFEERNLRCLSQIDGATRVLEHAKQHCLEASARVDASEVVDRLESIRQEDSQIEMMTCASLKDLAGHTLTVFAVMDVMRENDWSASIAATGLSCLETATRHSAAEHAEIGLPELEYVVSTMQRFKSNRDVQRRACTLLEYLAETDIGSRRNIIRARGGAALLDVIESSSEDEELLVASYAALRVLSEELECYLEFQPHIHSIENTAQRHPANILLHQHMEAILSHFSGHAALMSS